MGWGRTWDPVYKGLYIIHHPLLAYYNKLLWIDFLLTIFVVDWNTSFPLLLNKTNFSLCMLISTAFGRLQIAAFKISYKIAPIHFFQAPLRPFQSHHYVPLLYLVQSHAFTTFSIIFSIPEKIRRRKQLRSFRVVAQTSPSSLATILL